MGILSTLLGSNDHHTHDTVFTSFYADTPVPMRSQCMSTKRIATFFEVPLPDNDPAPTMGQADDDDADPANAMNELSKNLNFNKKAGEKVRIQKINATAVRAQQCAELKAKSGDQSAVYKNLCSDMPERSKKNPGMMQLLDKNAVVADCQYLSDQVDVQGLDMKRTQEKIAAASKDLYSILNGGGKDDEEVVVTVGDLKKMASNLEKADKNCRSALEGHRDVEGKLSEMIVRLDNKNVTATVQKIAQQIDGEKYAQGRKVE